MGKRHGVPSEEWPEFECHLCPVHKGSFSTEDEMCKRHRRETAAMESVMSEACGD